MNNYDTQIEMLAMKPLDYSPIVIIGNVGSGKTYFLEKYCKKRNKFYKPAFGEWGECEGAKIFNADEICQNIIDSIANGNGKSWSKIFAPIDVIIIDDFDRLAGKTTTQEMLFSYFLACNKAIIVAAKSEIVGEGFAEEISSFLSTGAHIYIDDPDKGTKLEFLLTNLCAMGINVEDEALLWLSKQNFISYAATKGFVKTLRLFTTDEPLSLSDCIKYSKDYIY